MEGITPKQYGNAISVGDLVEFCDNIFKREKRKNGKYYYTLQQI